MIRQILPCTELTVCLWGVETIVYFVNPSPHEQMSYGGSLTLYVKHNYPL